MSPIIAVDIGNSATKLALFAGGAKRGELPQPAWTHSEDRLADIPAALLAQLRAGARWRVGSVQREREMELAELVRDTRPDDEYRVLTYRDMPIEVRLDQPDRVGLDRLAAAVGANVLREPGRAAVVISAGSAVTVNLVSPEGVFEGGVILPGFRMSARALSSADLLPEVLFQSSSEPPPVLGKHTEAAIRSGLFWGTVGAVREIIERFAEGHRRPQVFVTGGDLERLAPLASAEARFVPNLVLSGIAVAAEL